MIRNLCLLAVLAVLATWAGRQSTDAPPVDARSAWAIDLLARLGNTQPSQDTIALVVAWTKAEDEGEGAFLRNNPLNTTQTSASETGTINSDGVKGYASYEDGMAATVQTLRYGYYTEIVSGLQGNDPERALRGMYASPWGTDMRNVEALWREARVSSHNAEQATVPIEETRLLGCPLAACHQSGFGYQSGHPGIDLAASLGQPVYASIAGVAHPSVSWPCGNGVAVDSGGVEVLVCHLSAIGVSDGEPVEAGQQIGAAGSTGDSTGPHVHYEIRVNGANVDPTGVLER